MHRTELHPMAAASTAFMMLLIASIQSANAEQPEPELRYFAVVLSSEQTLRPDLLAPESHLLIVEDQDATPGADIEFCNLSPLLGGTEWYHAETKHITEGGIETLNTFWLGEQPPNGAVAWTGPEGDVETCYSPLYWRPASGASPECSSAYWWVDDQAGATSITVYLGVGLFTR